MPEGVTHWDGPPLEAWKPWTPAEAARVLRGFTRPWCVVGGWALDLSLGRATRAHEDLEIAIARADFPTMRGLLEAGGYILREVGDGEVRALAPGAVTSLQNHQNWVFDPGANEWRMDVMLEPGDDETWVFRRDARIRAPRAFMIDQAPIPHLKAHGALLYKAKAAREKDRADFANAAPTLDAPARAWLIEALTLAHPGHEWIAALGA